MNAVTKCLVIGCLFALGAGPGLAREYRIGTVNAVRVLQQSPQTEVANKRIQQEFAEREAQIVADQKKLQGMEERLEKDQAVLSPAELQKLERDILSGRRDLKRDQDEYREDLSIRRNEELSRMQEIIVEAIQRVARDGKYDLVLSDGVVYAGQELDISDQVLELLKKNQGKAAR